ncbi:uncharacterized protein LOC127246073 [Andrographis paniculata]|uniref:uncharacterized protein LOC127246073 n=1 Tax=Andrographis paniculata TaxID=175694 RepID=UPI0021E9A9F2|nr:uncharacterized protein LOC127246073 [Andrographis paniculata]
MEDEKLAAYYDDLTRRGGGAARFKQGLGFSSATPSSDDVVPARGSALPTTSSFLSSFVKASSPSKTAEFEKESQLQSIQKKLGKKPVEKERSRSPSRKRSRSRSRSRSPSRDKHKEKRSRRRSRSRDRHSRRSRSRDRRSRKRSRSRSREYDSRRKNRSRSRSRSGERNKERSGRRPSPAGRRPEKSKKGGGAAIDYPKLIEGYDNMTPAERVKAKMKLQLSKTAENDEAIGQGTGWERFEFNKDAPLDDEEVEAVDDDSEVVKRIGQSFRFSAVEAKREETVKVAHDEAMFGGSSYPLPPETVEEAEEESPGKQSIETAPPAASLLSDQILMKQQGSWRDRLRKP